MHITFSQDNASELYRKANLLAVNQHEKKMWLLISGYALLAVVFFVEALGNGPDKAYSNGIALGIGIALAVAIIIKVLQLFQAKFRFAGAVQASIRRNFSLSDKIRLELTDEYVRMESESAKSEFNWRIITSFMLSGDYIFLLKDATFTSVIIIDRKLLTESELNELTAFLQQTKPRTTAFHRPL